MILGGVLTLLFTALALWRIPALLTFRDDQVTTPVDSDGGSCGSSKSAPEMKQGEESMEECGQEQQQEQQQLVEQPSNTHGKD